MVGDGSGMLNVDSISFKIIRQGQDFIGVIGCAGRSINAGGGKRAGSYPELVQIDSTGRLYVEFISGGLGESAGTHQIAIDEVIKPAAGNGDPHG